MSQLTGDFLLKITFTSKLGLQLLDQAVLTLKLLGQFIPDVTILHVQISVGLSLALGLAMAAMALHPVRCIMEFA